MGNLTGRPPPGKGTEGQRGAAGALQPPPLYSPAGKALLPRTGEVRGNPRPALVPWMRWQVPALPAQGALPRGAPAASLSPAAGSGEAKAGFPQAGHSACFRVNCVESRESSAAGARALLRSPQVAVCPGAHRQLLSQLRSASKAGGRHNRGSSLSRPRSPPCAPRGGGKPPPPPPAGGVGAAGSRPAAAQGGSSRGTASRGMRRVASPAGPQPPPPCALAGTGGAGRRGPSGQLPSTPGLAPRRPPAPPRPPRLPSAGPTAGGGPPLPAPPRSCTEGRPRGPPLPCVRPGGGQRPRGPSPRGPSRARLPAAGRRSRPVSPPPPRPPPTLALPPSPPQLLSLPFKARPAPGERGRPPPRLLSWRGRRRRRRPAGGRGEGRPLPAGRRRAHGGTAAGRGDAGERGG